MKLYPVFLLVLAAALSGGGSAPRNQNITSHQGNPTQPTPPQSEFSALLSDAPDGLRKRWDAAVADGRLRLAQASDFKLPHAEQPWPRHYGWSGELFAILIDTTETDSARYKLALFVPPENGKGDFKLYWVLHNHDLSRSKLSNASSNLVVYEYPEGGGRRNSHLEWDKTKKAYTAMVD